MSNAIKGMTSKFMHVFEGPYIITKLQDHSAYELRDESGKLRGEFNRKQLRQYQEPDNETQTQKNEMKSLLMVGRITGQKKGGEKPLSNRGWEVNDWLKIIILRWPGKLKR